MGLDSPEISTTPKQAKPRKPANSQAISKTKSIGSFIDEQPAEVKFVDSIGPRAPIINFLKLFECESCTLGSKL